MEKVCGLRMEFMGGVGCSVRRREEEMQQDAFGGSKTIRP